MTAPGANPDGRGRATKAPPTRASSGGSSAPADTPAARPTSASTSPAFDEQRYRWGATMPLPTAGHGQRATLTRLTRAPLRRRPSRLGSTP